MPSDGEEYCASENFETLREVEVFRLLYYQEASKEKNFTRKMKNDILLDFKLLENFKFW